MRTAQASSRQESEARSCSLSTSWTLFRSRRSILWGGVEGDLDAVPYGGGVVGGDVGGGEVEDGKADVGGEGRSSNKNKYREA